MQGRSALKTRETPVSSQKILEIGQLANSIVFFPARAGRKLRPGCL
jgi:hypothetical protein